MLIQLPPFSARHALFVLLAVSLGIVCSHGEAQPALATPSTVSQSATHSGETTVTIALVGETPGSSSGKGKKQHTDIVGITTHTLGLEVHDFTAAGQTLDATLRGIGLVLAQHPTVVIIFAGAADERARTSDDKEQYSLKAIINALAGTGARVYIVPSSPDLSTITAANLRLATGSQATYIETGSDIAGHPYQEAMQSIADAELHPKPVATPTPVPTPEPAETAQPHAVQQSSIPPLENAASTTASEAARPHGVFAAPTPAKADDLIERPTPKPDKESETTTQSRFVTKRGTDAQATINMRPPPALKNYSPQKPVPRTDVEKKAPDLAR